METVTSYKNQHDIIDSQLRKYQSLTEWMDGWLGFNGILRTQVADIMPEEV